MESTKVVLVSFINKLLNLFNITCQVPSITKTPPDVFSIFCFTLHSHLGSLNLLNHLGFLLAITGRLTPSLPLGSILMSPSDYSIKKRKTSTMADCWWLI